MDEHYYLIRDNDLMEEENENTQDEAEQPNSDLHKKPKQMQLQLESNVEAKKSTGKQLRFNLNDELEFAKCSSTENLTENNLQISTELPSSSKKVEPPDLKTHAQSEILQIFQLSLDQLLGETENDITDDNMVQSESHALIELFNCNQKKKAGEEMLELGKSTEEQLRLRSDAQNLNPNPEIVEENSIEDRLKSGAHTELIMPANSEQHLENKVYDDFSKIIADMYFGKSISTSIQTSDNNELNISSDLDEKLSDTEESNEQLLINDEIEESVSVNSYSSLSRSQEQLLLPPLDENYTLLDKIDMSSNINNDQEQLPELPNIESKLKSILLNKHMGDVQVYVGDTKFRCHMCILEMYSTYFKRCKEQQIYSIRLPTDKVTSKSFHIINKWMLKVLDIKYCRLNNRCLFDLLHAAKFLGIAEVLISIWDALDVRENMSFKLLLDKSHRDMPDIDSLLFSRISRFFLTLVSSLEFVELSDSYVCRLLTSHNVGVNSEIEIFYAAVRWLSHNWPQRQSHLPELLKCVRFGLLPPVFLRFLQSKQSTCVMNCISNHPVVKELINNAFVHVSTELYCSDPQQQLPFKLPSYEVIVERKWLFDSNCPYHQNILYKQHKFFTYDQFLAYLKTLHETGPEYWQNLTYLPNTLTRREILSVNIPT